MKTDFTVLSSYRNKDNVQRLINEIKKRGYSCYNFCDEPADPDNAHAHPETQMEAFEATQDFHNSEHFKKLFHQDLEALRNAHTAILLHPCGLAAHMEAGIAFGLGKPLIMIGKPPKPETLYLMFQERYPSIDDFLAIINEKMHEKAKSTG